MYYARLTFTFHKPVNITDDNVDELSGPLWAYLGSLYQMGNIILDNELIYRDGVFYAYFTMPALDSIDEKYVSEYAKKDLDGLKKQFTIKMDILGKDTTGLYPCSCKESSWYILYANRMFSASPIYCGDCFQFIPTYKFSYINTPKDVRTPLGWMQDYILIDKLWFNSYFDRFTYRQMSDPNSRLSKDGMAICSAYEKAIGKPFYFFLFYYNESRKPHESCPICGAGWHIEEKISFISYKCDKCRIVSCC